MEITFFCYCQGSSVASHVTSANVLDLSTLDVIDLHTGETHASGIRAYSCTTPDSARWFHISKVSPDQHLDRLKTAVLCDSEGAPLDAGQLRKQCSSPPTPSLWSPTVKKCFIAEQISPVCWCIFIFWWQDNILVRRNPSFFRVRVRKYSILYSVTAMAASKLFPELRLNAGNRHDCSKWDLLMKLHKQTKKCSIR